jgi:hypothetical protein
VLTGPCDERRIAGSPYWRLLGATAFRMTITL